MLLVLATSSSVAASLRFWVQHHCWIILGSCVDIKKFPHSEGSFVFLFVFVFVFVFVFAVAVACQL